MEGLVVNPENYQIARWVFLRLLGIIYLIAFASFGIQVSGLIGEKGILPTRKFLAAVQHSLARKGYFYYPTLAWISSSDAFLKSLCLLGAVLAVLLLCGIQTTPVLVLLWVLYLSLVIVGQVFLSYQWDALLVETGFLSIFLVPPSLLPNQTAGLPSPIVIFLFRWLLFRLMFMSGLVKLTSGDPTWRSLTALAFHYETQPLPTPLGWLIHHAPLNFHKFSTLFSLFVELFIPFLYFAPGLPRYAAGGLAIYLMLLIMATGNFAFFNLLTIALTVFLFPDALWRRILPARLSSLELPAPSAGLAWGNFFLIPLAVILVAAGLVFILARLNRRSGFLKYAQPLIQVVASLRIANPYGLFAAMTTRRPEIIIEGSNDYENWSVYEFKYKADDLKRAPPVVAPHQPRLDWQMWFAALGSYADNPWFLNFIERLLTGSPEVVKLLARNPFPDRPPRYIRAVLYDYHYTSIEERAETGNWWRRERLGLYLPPASLET